MWRAWPGMRFRRYGSMTLGVSGIASQRVPPGGRGADGQSMLLSDRKKPTEHFNTRGSVHEGGSDTSAFGSTPEGRAEGACGRGGRARARAGGRGSHLGLGLQTRCTVGGEADCREETIPRQCQRPQVRPPWTTSGTGASTTVHVRVGENMVGVSGLYYLGEGGAGAV